MRPLRCIRRMDLGQWHYCVITLIVATIFINEYLVYCIQSWRWPAFPPRKSSDLQNEQVALLVADPQLQGYQDEAIFPVGQLARWDIDRFLQKGFSYAYTYTKPDIVIFLGDLMDEGSKALGQEYMETLHRFHSVFNIASHIKKIYIPGDNDIGGEHIDFRTEIKEKRFERHFENISGVVRFGFIDYIKTDVKTSSISTSKLEEMDRVKQKLTSPFRVLVNHESMLGLHSAKHFSYPKLTSPFRVLVNHESMLGLHSAKHFSYPILKRTQSKLILTGHWHRSRIYKCTDCLKDDQHSWSVERYDMSMIDDYIEIDLRGQYSLSEIAVPTCSYRMGEKNMGYGVAIIGNHGIIQYTVLWLPRRYTSLLSYLFVLVVVVVSYYLKRKCIRDR